MEDEDITKNVISDYRLEDLFSFRRTVLQQCDGNSNLFLILQLITSKLQSFIEISWDASRSLEFSSHRCTAEKTDVQGFLSEIISTIVSHKTIFLLRFECLDSS